MLRFDPPYPHGSTGVLNFAEVSSVYLHAGERFDLLLCAEQPFGAYALVADACAEAPGVAECKFSGRGI